METRRSVDLSNVEELGPGAADREAARAAARGSVNAALARTLDVTPTIADVLNVPLGYRADGRSAFSRAVRARRTVSIVKRDFSSRGRGSPRAGGGAPRRGRAPPPARARLRRLGEPVHALRAAPRPDRPARSATCAAPRRPRATLVAGALVRPTSAARAASCPTQVAGRIRGSGPSRERDIAVAVNGRIAAVGRSFHLRGRALESYSVMVPEDSLREGRNRVEVLEVSDGGSDGAAGSQLSWPPLLAARGLQPAGRRGAGAVRRAPPAGGGRRVRRVPGGRPAAAPTAASTPSASRTSRSSPRSPPGSRTGTRSTTRPSRRCPRSSTAARRGPRTAADVRSHKPSIFHVMDRLGYEVFKVESASAVCPPDICPGARTRRPGVLGAARRRTGGRRASTSGSARSGTGRQPAFYFQHALMPHEPWIYLPSGRQSRPAGTRADPADQPARRASTTRTSPIHNHLRHLLQVGYTDRLVGELLARLRRTGLLERALIVVTADHGYSFQVGVREPAPAERAQRRGDRARCRCSSRRPARWRARSTTASCATSTWSRRSPTCSGRRSC